MKPFLTDDSLLLELPVPFKRTSSGLLVEAQALNGLRCWSDNFSRMTVCAPLLPESQDAESSTTWRDPAGLLAERAITLIALPWGYHPRDYLRQRRGVKAQLASLIATHRYLCFSNIGGIGAWGSLAASIAAAQRRPYSLWFDSVVHNMPQPASSSLLQAARRFFLRYYVRRETFKAIRRSALGLFHGKTVYNAYAPYAKVPALVHDVHVAPQDAISQSALEVKLASASSRCDLRIGYVGRLHPIKAPLEWIQAVADAIDEGGGVHSIQATWLGDGPMMAEAQQYVAARGMQAAIHFPGFVADRHALLEFLRALDVLVFCHVTPESPRCLLESLISGTPLVGYASAYAEDLVGDRGGAALVPMHDVTALTKQIRTLASDRKALCDLIHCAAASSGLYNDTAVFAHRSDLIKQHLP